MRHQFHCRRCESLSLSASGRRSFYVPGAKPHYAPDLPVKLEHIALEVEVDPRAKTLQGLTTQQVRIVAPGLKRFRMDQVGIQVGEVQIAGHKAKWTIDGHALWVDLPEAVGVPAPGDRLEVQVRYSVRDPKRGLYFTGPDADYPQKPYQVWSQGQDEDNRYWFPTFDYPNQKATSEIIATVPKGYTAVSNGALLSRKDEGAKTRYHYRLGTPHVTYLISLVVAEFSQWEDQGPRGIPVQYFVQPGKEEDGKRAFGNTPRMIEAFEAATGVPYAYEKYSQAAVQDFIFGGMENTSATTQTEKTLHDARAHLDVSSDPLVSHELAHQWFGDLVTCRDWSHGWLNEGFATFMERVWIEANHADFGGEKAAQDEAKYYSLMDLRDHLDEDTGHYRRPIVCNTYLEPIDLFDTHLYQKGGLVLNLIRSVLGPELFWKSVNLYLSRHRGQNVETLDLIRAIEDATGRNLRRFFDEWVFSAGYPEFELTYQWHEDKKLVELVIEQKQTDGKAELVRDGVTTPLFHLPVPIELTLEGGAKVTHVIEVGELRDRVFLPAAAKPLMVRFDPGHNIPKTLKFPRPKELLLYQLKQDADCMGRIEAAHELAKIADSEVVDALGQQLLADSFWGVQAEIASALAEIRTDRARDALAKGLGVRNPKARRAVVKALGTFRDDAVAGALKKLADKDESYLVEAEATYEWARAHLGQREPGSELSARAETAEKFLIQQLSKASYNEVIRAAALKALGELPGVGQGERPQALATLMEWSRRGKPEDARLGAVLALGAVAKTAAPAERHRILDWLDGVADEPNFRLRLRMIQALGSTESPRAISTLEKIRATDADGRVKRSAMSMSSALQAAATSPESLGLLRSTVEKLQEEHRKLRSMLEEKRSGPPFGFADASK